MYKLFKVFLSIWIIVLLFPSISFANNIDNKNITESSKEYITVTPTSNKLISMWDSLVSSLANITSYDVTYSFKYWLESSNSYYIDWPSVCFKTSPISQVSNPPYWNSFQISLKKWIFSTLPAKTLYANDWLQIVKWANVGAWNYKIRLSKWNDDVYFSDNSARIYNCN